MLRYIVRRFLHIIPLLIGISLISFFIIQLAPGDFLTQQALNPQVSAERIAQERARFGLDKPIYLQYLLWLKNILRLDFGYSFAYRVPVFTLIKSKLYNTFILSLSAMIFTWVLSIPLGIISAVKQYSWLDKSISIFAFLGLAIPNFFFALLLLYMAMKTGWFPVGGMYSINYESLSLLAKIWNRIYHLILPTIVLGTAGMAGLVRQMRGNLLDYLKEDFIITARAKGLSERVVILKHAVRNAINPLITLFGFALPGLLSGAALTEIVMSWPGLGRLMLEAVLKMDLYLVMGSLMMGAVLLILGNLVADLMLAWVDPRIRYD
ncbi:ABC transporter permease [Patescibacteria group bacterium]|nr:ABC transporter permease [Patescibacteria group bacterium]